MNLKNVVKGIGANAARQGRHIGRGTAGTLGMIRWASNHQIETTAVALGAAYFASYGSTPRNTVPAGQATQEDMPGSYRGKSNYDLGASGDLVFALHRLNQ